jgi:hypothetical protein
MKRILIIVTITLAAIAANVQAQMVSGGVDTVSVGSQMPYAVTPDANIEAMVGSGLLDQSQFDWIIESGTGTINTTQSGLSLYPDSILITWGGSPEDAQISVAENSVKSGAVLCAGAKQTLDVVIVDLPTLDATYSTAACGLSNHSVPVDLTGIGPWEISFEIEYTDLSGSTSTFNDSETVGTIGSTDGTYNLPINLTSLSGVGSGEYTVSITSIDDRISSKALNDINGTATASIQIISAPTPNTGAIRHIDN